MGEYLSTSTASERGAASTSQDIIYVLELAKGKYYVGRTSSPAQRLVAHLSGNGSTWSKAYPPVSNKYLHTYSCATDFDEDYRVKQMMSEHGINNVRGGSYCTMILLKEQIISLEKELATSNNSCFKCGSKDHYSANCNTVSPGMRQCSICKQLTIYPKAPPYVKVCFGCLKTDTGCIKCGKVCHSISKCVSKRDIRLSCTKCNKIGHLAVKCYVK